MAPRDLAVLATAALILASSAFAARVLQGGSDNSDLSQCAHNCPDFPADATTGQCVQHCDAKGCCINVWTAPSSDGPDLIGACPSGTCEHYLLKKPANLTDLEPCMACDNFPPSYKGGICFPNICEDSKNYAAFALILDDGKLAPGGCELGTCSAP